MSDSWAHLIAYFWGGVFTVCAIPSVVSATMGRSFQTPFVWPKDRGTAHSSSAVNALWGWLNVWLGYSFLLRIGDFDPRNTNHAVAVGSGGFLMTLLMAVRMGRFNGGNNP